MGQSEWSSSNERYLNDPLFHARVYVVLSVIRDLAEMGRADDPEEQLRQAIRAVEALDIQFGGS